MPATLRDLMRRKLAQSDNNLRRAIAHLADVYATVQPQHPEIAAALRTYMVYLDHVRQFHRDFTEEHWGESFHRLWERSDLPTALADARILKDPKQEAKRR